MDVENKVLSFVLDGLEAALELERELGVRMVEIDRTLLSDVLPAVREPRVEEERAGQHPHVPPAPRIHPVVDSPQPSRQQLVTNCQLVFLHDRSLSEKGAEMMAKIIAAMGRTAENAPILVAPPFPRAKIIIVLGGLALKKYFPEMRGEPGQWQKTAEGSEVLITYSPEYILRFATITPAVRKIKQDMWRSLKTVVQRLG